MKPEVRPSRNWLRHDREDELGLPIWDFSEQETEAINASRPPDYFWGWLEAQLKAHHEFAARHGWAVGTKQLGRPPTRDECPEHSDLWYALHIGHWLEALLSMRSHADLPQEAVASAYLAGQLTTEMMWRRSFRSPIKTGRKQQRHLTDLRTAKNTEAKSDVEERRRIIAALLRETGRKGGALRIWIIERLAKQNIWVSDRTVRRDLLALRRG